MTPEPAAVSAEFTTADLAETRRLVHAAAIEAGLGARAEPLIIAVNEVVVNAVRYGGGRGEIHITQLEDGLAIDVSDHGPGLTRDIPTARPAPDAPGGRGLWIAGQMCDEIQIDTDTDGTRVRMIMYRTESA